MAALKRDSQAQLRLGFAGAAAGLWPSALAREIRSASADVAVRLVDVGIGATTAQLERRLVDVAVLTSPAEFPTGIAHVVLGRSRVVTATPRHPRSIAARSRDAAQLGRIRLRDVPPDWPSAATDAVPGEELLADSYDDALDLVAADSGLFLTLASCAQRHSREDVVHVPRLDLPEGTVFLSWRTGNNTYAVQACCSAAGDLIAGRNFD